MTENEFLLADRIQKIQSVMRQYGEDNFCISFSGGKDSTVLHYLVDMALPDNKIPRVYANTGIELNIVRDFVLELQKSDDRIVVIQPSVPIKPMLEQEGYPFKSKEHSQNWREYDMYGIDKKRIQRYLGNYRRPTDTDETFKKYRCPDVLLYQFEEQYKKDGIKISDRCCYRLKEEPFHKWQEKNKRPYAIIGLMKAEGGRRKNAKCMAFKSKGRMNFQPLVVVSKEWEEWFIGEYNIKLCDIYKPPYCFERTGCKGCPFAFNLQEQLDTIERFFPAERKQCEIIWKPVYDEYRRLGYRLRPDENIPGQMSFEDYYGGEMYG